MRRLNETKDFLNILLDADAFWKTYLADSHHIKQPAVIDQAENVPNVGAIERQAVEVKIKRESSPQPEAVFLPCNSSEVGDNQFEVKEEIGYDSTGSTEVADFQDSFEANIEITNELEQSDANLVRKYNKKIKLVVRCEYCDKGKHIFGHFIQFIYNSVFVFQSCYQRLPLILILHYTRGA